MKIMLLGSPGVGKGTQAKMLSNKYHIPQISTGDILRAEIGSTSELGAEIKSYLDAGKLVPDELMIKIVKKRLAQKDCDGGFLLDGFPRTLAQAQALVDQSVTLDCVVVLEVPTDEVVKRLSGRRSHLPSGRTYHIDYHPPKVPDVDDVTGEPLVQRDDDKPEVIRKRLDVYQQETSPLVDFYQKVAGESDLVFAKIDGQLSVDEVQGKIESYLSHISH